MSIKNPVNIILTEVIEHNTPKAAEALVKHCLSLNFHKMIITTPNSLFNKYYFDEDPESLRHEDHHSNGHPKSFKTLSATV